jgi:hypothetical protein
MRNNWLRRRQERTALALVAYTLDEVLPELRTSSDASAPDARVSKLVFLFW